MLIADDQDLPTDPLQAVQQPDELGNTEIPPHQLHQQPLTAARCVNGSLVRPDNAEEEHPSTACRQSAVTAPGGVTLGRGSPGQQHSPGVYEDEIYLYLRHHRHHLQHQFRMLQQHPVQLNIQCNSNAAAAAAPTSATAATQPAAATALSSLLCEETRGLAASAATTTTPTVHNREQLNGAASSCDDHGHHFVAQSLSSRPLSRRASTHESLKRPLHRHPAI